jgi:hypothetical protein
VTTDVITARNFAGLTVETPQARVPTFNALIYGESSVGKTTLAAGVDGVPQMRSVLFVDIEKGDLSIRKTPYRPDVVRLTSWNQLKRLYHELLVGPEVHGYNTVVIDSLGEVVDLNLKDIMIEEAGAEDETPEWKHWNMNQVRMLRLLRDFRDLPINVIFTSLVKEDTDKKTFVTRKLPDLPGKLAGKVPAIFDNVFYYFMKEVQLPGEAEKVNRRLLLTTKTPDTVAKNRGSDKLPNVIVVPPVNESNTMKLIYDAIIGSEL